MFDIPHARKFLLEMRVPAQEALRILSTGTMNRDSAGRLYTVQSTLSTYWYSGSNRTDAVGSYRRILPYMYGTFDEHNLARVRPTGETARAALDPRELARARGATARLPLAPPP